MPINARHANIGHNDAWIIRRQTAQSRLPVTMRLINPTADGNWSFVPLPKTAIVTFASAPAAAQAATPPGLGIEPMGDAGDGFAKYRLVFGS